MSTRYYVTANLGAVLAASCLMYPSTDLLAANGEAVKIDSGIVQGFSDEGVRKFLGIPFAKPPVGPLRWTSPKAPDPWVLPRDASKFGPTCAQNKRLGDFANASTSEDCLYINVFAPKNKAKKLPVMVWIYGGGLFVGESNDYDGSRLVKSGDVVFVSFNYRLNEFGFLAHPALVGDGQAANYGLQDQQFALKWVQRNIAQFGGDPDNVTIFGESAGGYSVTLNMISPLSRGLYAKGIVESGAYGYESPQPTLAQAEATGEQFAQAIGCKDQSAACLRKASVERILSQEANYFLGPVIDGVTIKKSVKDAIKSGDFNRHPIIDGTNHDEYRWFQAFAELSTGHVITAAEYPTQVVNTFGQALAPDVLRRYPLKNFNSPSEALAAAFGDDLFSSSAQDFNVAVSKYVPTYAYEFADENAPNFLHVSFPYGAYHTAEIQYLFPGYKGAYTGKAPGLNRAQQELSSDMIAYWTAFAKTGNPNNPDAPRWQAFTSTERVQSLNTPISSDTKNFAHDHLCPFWNQVFAGTLPAK